MSSNIILPHFNYIPVDLETFVAHTDIDFDLYIFNPQDQRTVLFCSKDKAFTEGNRRSLLRNKIKELYITANDYMAYLRYVEKVLPSIITSVRFEEKEKVDYIFQCANLIMEDTVDEPDSQANVKRSRRFVKNVINYIGYRTQFFYSFLERLERNYSLRAHSLNVCVYSLAIVKKLNIHSLRTLEDVGLGSLLHDVGMTMIPDEILSSKETLSANDRALIEQHPLLGVELLKGIEDCSPGVLDIVTSHHEKLDGSGYPHSIVEGDISHPVRIVAVADIFDALHSHRPYRDALSTYEAFFTMAEEFKGKIDRTALRQLISAFSK